MEIKYNDTTKINFNIEGERKFGKEIVLLEEHDDLTIRTSWKDTGYGIFPFLSENEYHQFMKGIQHLFFSFFDHAAIKLPSDFSLAAYHQYIGDHYDLHLAIVNQAKLLPTEKFPIDVAVIEKCVSEICQVPVQAVNPHTGEQVFHFRIVRPRSHDNNPFHRDVWLEEYHDAINIYLPICGSNENSSLTVIPCSHRWSEAVVERTLGGAKVDGIQYNVPAVTGTKFDLSPVRPNPGTNEIMVFSPYLLHGGAVNLNQHITRISLEMRFWRKNDLN